MRVKILFFLTMMSFSLCNGDVSISELDTFKEAQLQKLLDSQEELTQALQTMSKEDLQVVHELAGFSSHDLKIIGASVFTAWLPLILFGGVTCCCLANSFLRPKPASGDRCSDGCGALCLCIFGPIWENLTGKKLKV